MATQLADGLWTWHREHPDWDTRSNFEPEVASYALRLGTGVLLIDPLWPEEDSEDFAWLDGIARSGLLLVAALKPDHTRDAAGIARAYGGRVIAGEETARGLSGEAPVRVADPGTKLLEGVRVLEDRRGRGETPLWIPSHRAVAFADALRGDPGGDVLRVWSYPPGREDEVREALAAIADLEPEHVLVGHGAAVIGAGAAALRAALDRPPYEEE